MVDFYEHIIIKQFMQNKTYFKTVGIIFALVFILHGLRAINGWQAEIGNWIVPMWISWLAVAISGFLCFVSFKKIKGE
jgi:hypothetical protein